MVGVGGSSPLGRTKFKKIPLSSGIFAFCRIRFSYSKALSHSSLILVLCLKKALPCLNLQARSDLVVPKPDPYPIRHGTFFTASCSPPRRLIKEFSGNDKTAVMQLCNDPAVPAQLSGLGIGLRRGFHLQRLMRALLVVKLDPVANHSTGML